MTGKTAASGFTRVFARWVPAVENGELHTG